MAAQGPGCVKTLCGMTAPGISRLVVTLRAKRRKNSSSARRYDQIRFRFRTAWVDTVEKVDRKSRVRNNRIKKGRYSNRRCVNEWLFESKLRRVAELASIADAGEAWRGHRRFGRVLPATGAPQTVCPSLKRRLTLDVTARVTRIDRAEPQTRRASREPS